MNHLPRQASIKYNILELSFLTSKSNRFKVEQSQTMTLLPLEKKYTFLRAKTCFLSEISQFLKSYAAPCYTVFNARC